MTTAQCTIVENYLVKVHRRTHTCKAKMLSNYYMDTSLYTSQKGMDTKKSETLKISKEFRYQ